MGTVTLPQPPNQPKGIFQPSNPQDKGKFSPTGEPGSLSSGDPNSKPIIVIMLPPQNGQSNPTFTPWDDQNPISG